MSKRDRPGQPSPQQHGAAQQRGAVQAPGAAPEQLAHLVLYASVRPSMAPRWPQLVALSHGSLIVRAHKLLRLGQRARLTLHMLDSGLNVEIEAKAVQVNHSLSEMALRFVTIDDGGPEAIAEYIDHLASER